MATAKLSSVVASGRHGRRRPARRPFRDNPPLILAGIVILLAVLGGIVWLADRTSTLSPDFLTEVVLIALSATNVTMLRGAGVRAGAQRHQVDRGTPRGLPFGRFRAKLVLSLLGMTVIPAVLVLIVGSRVVLTAVDRWFNAPMEEILSGANSIAGDYYQERERLVADQASRLARSLSRLDLASAGVASVQNIVTPEVAGQRIGMVQVYRVVRVPNQPADVISLVDVASPSMPQGLGARSADRLAARAASGEAAPSIEEPMAAGGVLMHVATRRSQRRRADHRRRGRERLPLRRSRRARAAHDEGLRGLHAAARAEAAAGRRLPVVLRDGDAADPGRLDLDGPVSRQAHHAPGADAVGGRAGDRRRPLRSSHRARRHATSSARWSKRSTRWRPKSSQSRRRLERASIDLERKHDEGEGRRRYIETILERIATGVVSIDRAGRIGTINPSALRLLELTDDVIGHAAVDVFARAGPRARERRARPGGAREDGFVRAGSGAGPRRPRAARRRRRHAHRRHRRQLRRHRAGGRRRDAADPRAEGGGLARSGAAAGARDQEPADADSAVGRAAAPQARRCLAAAAGPGAGMHVDDHRRGRVAEGPGRRVLAVRAHAGAARRADRAARVSERHAGALRRPVRLGRVREALRPASSRRCGSIPSR